MGVWDPIPSYPASPNIQSVWAEERGISFTSLSRLNPVSECCMHSSQFKSWAPWDLYFCVHDLALN